MAKTPCACISGSLCGPCTRVLMDDLRVIAGEFGGYPFRTLIEELEITTTRMDKIGTMNVGSVSTGEKEQPMLFNERASEARHRLKLVLARTCGEMVRRYPHLHLPQVNDMSGWLLVVSELLRQHPRVNEIARAIRGAVAAAQRVIDRPVDRLYLGSCAGVIDGLECGVPLYASEKTPDTITCRVCESTWHVAELRWTLIRKLDEELVTASQVDGWVCPDGTEIKKGTIRQWKSRGLIEAQGKRGKADLFRMGDITARVMLRDQGCNT